MTPATALQTIRAAGVSVLLDGADLIVKATTRPSAEIVALIRESKPALVELLRQDVIDAFEERAAIAEFDGGLTRAEAEALARLEIDPEGEVMRQRYAAALAAIENDPFALL